MRRDGWEARLAHLEMAARARPFAWGEHDCCTWAAECVQAVTGTDPLADLRGTWHSAEAAQAVLQRLGGLRAAVDARLGEPLPSVHLAQRGDVVLLAVGNTMALGVCMGRVAVAPGPDGLVRIDMATQVGDQRPLAAWRT